MHARPTLRSTYDAIVLGGGHNGLVAAAYLAKAGKSVCVLERRHVLGGCATTEELWPGYKVSTAAFLIRSAPDPLPLPAEWRTVGVGKRLRDMGKLWELHQALAALGESLPEALE